MVLYGSAAAGAGTHGSKPDKLADLNVLCVLKEITPQELSDWLQSPMTFAPGTMMAYPGIKNDQTRADVIAYLNNNSASPIKLPSP